MGKKAGVAYARGRLSLPCLGCVDVCECVVCGSARAPPPPPPGEGRWRLACARALAGWAAAGGGGGGVTYPGCLREGGHAHAAGAASTHPLVLGNRAARAPRSPAFFFSSCADWLV